MSLKHLWIVLLLCSLNNLNAQIYYVQEGGTGTGTSWSDASGNINDVLSIATAGDQVWVSAGTYYPVLCNPCTNLQRLNAFDIPNGLEVYGGFTGTETILNERDWESNKTILSGDIDRDGTSANNSSTIVYFDRVSAATIIDGFSVIDGYAYTPGASDAERENSGAAIFNQGGLTGSASHPKILNCTFSNNIALGFGGAISNNGSFEGSANPLLENCTFSNNISERGGGAIFNNASFSGFAQPAYISCYFINNHATDGNGGGVYNQASGDGDCSQTFIGCYFNSNTSSDYGGGIHSHGRDGKSNVNFENCTFRSNEAVFGGGVSNNGTSDGEANASFTNCLFDQNHVTGDGAGLYNWGSNGVANASLLDCVFLKNNSDFAGAGMFNNGIDGTTIATVTNCRFIDNVATTYGGAMYNNGKRGDASATITNCLFQNNSGNSAGAVYNLGSENGNCSPIITNCTFYGNTANVGAAVYNNASDSTGTSNPIITNCIFWKNKANFGDVFRNILATPFIQYSVVDQVDCVSMNSGLGSNVSCGEGVLYNVYPEFEDTLGRDFRLKSISPILDLGNNEAINMIGIDFDLDHQNRIFNNTVDLGAFEFFDDYVAPEISTQPLGATLCEQEVLNISIAATGTPPLNYQWFKDNNPVSNATSTDLTIPVVDVADMGNYFCRVISTVGDTVDSDLATVSIDPILIPEVNIEASALEVCEGESITFSAITANEGDNPTFIWTLNGDAIGENIDSLLLSDLMNGDEVMISVNSSLNCAQPLSDYDTIAITVLPLLEPIINISGPDSITCLGEEVTFTASYSNGGLDPDLQWQVNGSDVSGQNSDIFITNTLNNADQVSCQLTSSEQCVVENSVASNELTAQIDSCITNLQTIIDNKQVQIIPNPSNGTFEIDFINLTGAFNVVVSDLSGRIFYDEMINFNVDNQRRPIFIPYSGVYFVKIFNDKLLNIQRIIINK